MGGMKYIGAYLLDVMGGNTPSADSMKEILEAAGMEVDATLVSLVLKKCEGKSVNEIMAAGTYYSNST